MSTIYCIRDSGTVALPAVRRCAPMYQVYQAKWEAEIWVRKLRCGIAVQVEDLAKAFNLPSHSRARRRTCEELAELACDRIRRLSPDAMKVHVKLIPLNTPSNRCAEVMWTI